MRSIFTVATGLVAATLSAAASTPTCADGLYIIVARGSDEPRAAGPNGLFPALTGSAGLIGNLIADKIDGSAVVGVDYPATIASIPNYIESENKGAKAMLKMASDYSSACPNSKMALLGYSQGAQVATDVICGGAGGAAGDAKALSADIVKSSITAALVWGDPTHVANATYNHGTSTHDGIFSRQNIDACLKYKNIIGSWCDKNDVFCDSGDSQEVHEAYIQKYNTTLVDFVVDKWTSSQAAATKTQSAPTSSATAPVDKPAAASTLGAAQGLLLGGSMILFALALASS